MSDPSSHTRQLHLLLDRSRVGDRAAREELFRLVSARLEHLARNALRTFPRVKRWAEACDVVQNAVIRLLRALDEVQPTTVQDFLSLAAVHLRRSLLDLVRQVRSRKGDLTQRVSDLADSDSDEGGYRPLDPGEDPAEVDRWCKFHQEVEKLPAEEREVVSLIYYHGWKQADVANLLHISERTVRRRWDAALAKVKHNLKGS